MRILFVALTIWMFGSPVLGQAPPASPMCFESQPKDSIRMQVVVRVSTRDTAAKVPAEFLNNVAQEISTRIKVPNNLALSVFGMAGYADNQPVKSGTNELEPRDKCISIKTNPGLSAAAYFWVRRNQSKIPEPVIINTSLNPNVEDFLVYAFQSVSESGTLPRYPDSIKSDSFSAKLNLMLLRKDDLTKDSVRKERWISTGIELTLPQYTMNTVEVKNQRKGRYPINAQRDGVEGTAVLSYVIDENGKVVPYTIDMVWVDHMDFLKEAVSILYESTYTPASINGCPVKSVAVQPVVFKLDYGKRGKKR